MQDLKVSLIQLDQSWENIPENLKKFEFWIQKCVGSDLIVLPEMFHTSFSMNVTLAEEWKENSIVKQLLEWSKKIDAAIYTSIMVKDQEKYFNRGVFIYPSGNMASYDKRKSFGLGGEDKVFEQGNNEKIVEWKGWKINLQICYDLRFPELIRNRIEANSEPAYDLLIYVANWPKKRMLHWTTLLQARAIENQCVTIGVNRIGLDGNDLEYPGASAIYDALGKTLVFMDENEGVCTNVLSFSELKEARTNLPFLKDRK